MKLEEQKKKGATSMGDHFNTQVDIMFGPDILFNCKSFNKPSNVIIGSQILGQSTGRLST